MKKTLLFLVAALTFGFAANAQTAFSEDFQGGALPNGWTVIADDLTNNSNYASFNQSWDVTQVSDDGNYAAVSISWTVPEGNDCDRWLITPSINVPATGYNLMADIWGRDVSYPEKVRVLISTTGTDKNDFTEVLDVVMDGQNYSNGWNTVMINLDNYVGQNIHFAFVNHGDGYYTILDNVAVKVIPANGIAAIGASASSWTAQNANISVSLSVRNDGSAPLTSFDINYTVNNGTEQTTNVTGINVAPFTTYTHVFTAATAGLGENIVAITVSNPNGEADADASDNSTSCSTTVYDPSQFSQRTSLLEHFTTGKCVWCPYGHQRLSAAIEGMEDKIVWVSHHIGYYTDEMTLNESNQIGNMFGLGGAPMMMLDRNAEFAIESTTAIGSVGDVDQIRDAFTASSSTPAYVSIALDNLSYDPQSRQLTVTVSGNFVQSYEGATPHITLWTIEDGIIAAQADAYQGTLTNYEHNHVLRSLVDGIWGEETGITNTTAGSTFSRTFNYTLPNHIRANKCRLVAFVNEFGTGANNRKVLNATQSGYLMTGEDPTVGINTVETSINVVTYPNPATEMAYVTANGTIRNYEMVDALGRKVMGQENVNADILELNVNSLSAGVYFISVTTDNGVATQRLSVVK